VLQVESGSECGLKLKEFEGLQVGDKIICRKIEMRTGKLVLQQAPNKK
jgi:hypothetical protein